MAIRHEFKEGTTLNEDETTRLRERLQTENARPKATFAEILDNARQWENEHSPFDRTGRMNLFQYVIEEGTGGALVPFQTPDQERAIPTTSLLPHAHDQLLARLDYAKRTYDRLPPKLNLLAVNWLIQNYYAKEVLLRIQDGDKVRALMSTDFEPFDNLELLTVVEPFIGDGEVKWYHSDEMTLHVTVTWPNTEEVIKVGDAVRRGIHISNSETGLRSVTIAGVVDRLVCSNLLIGHGDGGGIRRFRHVGNSDKLRDQVKGAIDETFLESTKVMAQFRASLEKAVEDPYNYLERVAKDKTNDMSQEQFKAAMNAFMLEPDDNLFAVTNAITRGAQAFDGEQRYDMQRLGAKVLAEGLRTRS